MTEQTKTAPVSLSSLMTSSKTVTIEFPGMQDFNVDLCYLAREELLKLRSKCLKQKFNKKPRAFEEQLDEDTFLVEYVASAIKNWTGLKYDYLRQLILIETDNLNLEDELPFSKENAEILMKNSGDFDTWVTETVGDLENFTMIK